MKGHAGSFTQSRKGSQSRNNLCVFAGLGVFA